MPALAFRASRVSDHQITATFLLLSSRSCSCGCSLAGGFGTVRCHFSWRFFLLYLCGLFCCVYARMHACTRVPCSPCFLSVLHGAQRRASKEFRAYTASDMSCECGFGNMSPDCQVRADKCVGVHWCCLTHRSGSLGPTTGPLKPKTINLVSY